MRGRVLLLVLLVLLHGKGREGTEWALAVSRLSLSGGCELVRRDFPDSHGAKERRIARGGLKLV